jgi:hypothetical protein
MPGSFPAATPTLSGNDLTISRFLQSPALLQRRLRDFNDLRFVSDQILTGRFRSQGGAVLYETAEPFVTDRAVEAVGPGSEYPYANLPTGTASVAAIQKWGQKVFLTDEEIARNAYAGSAVDRALRKVVNSIISQVDALTMSAISSAVTRRSPSPPVAALRGARRCDLPAGHPAGEGRRRWPEPGLPAGHAGRERHAVRVPDDRHDADEHLASRGHRQPGLHRVVENVAGLNIIVSPAIASGNAYVLDSTQLGGMADETDGAPGYAVSDLAVQVKSIRQDQLDAWDLQGAARRSRSSRSRGQP